MLKTWILTNKKEDSQGTTVHMKNLKGEERRLCLDQEHLPRFLSQQPLTIAGIGLLAIIM